MFEPNIGVHVKFITGEKLFLDSKSVAMSH